MTATLRYLISGGDGLAVGRELNRAVQWWDQRKYRIILLSTSLFGQEFKLLKRAACRGAADQAGRLTKATEPGALNLPGLSDLLRKLQIFDQTAADRNYKKLLFSFLKRAGFGCLYLPPLSRAEVPFHFSTAAWQGLFSALLPSSDEMAEREVSLIHIDRLYAGFLLPCLPGQARPLQN